jgi:hypothetical protein
VVDEADVLERAVGVLVRGDEAGGVGEDGLVDVDEAVGLCERLEDEGCQEQTALGVAVSEGGEAAV